MDEALKKLLNGDIAGFLKDAQQLKPDFDVEPDKMAEQFNVKEHAVFDATKRRDKTVFKPTLDSNGDPKMENGVVKTNSVLEPVNRVGLPYQEVIVDRRVGFLLGNPIELELEHYEGDDSVIMGIVQTVWDDNKLDYRNMDIATRMFSECEVAELWYFKEDPDFWKYQKKIKASISSDVRPKMKILSPELGDTLYKYVDDYDDMIAFLRKFKKRIDGKDVDHLDIFTAEFTYHYKLVNGSWLEVEGIGKVENIIGKIPIVYYRQNRPEWYRVQEAIERRETLLSNLGDENDYFGSPILFVQGSIKGFASKGERGKVIEGEANTTVSYVTYDHAPESIKMELEELESSIYEFTQTPNISFENVKGMGNVSGIALKLMFIDAHMAAKRKETTFGEGVQRRLNLLKAIAGKVIHTASEEESMEINIVPAFTPYLPEDMETEINVLSTAVNSGIMTKETGVRQNPLVSNKENEIELLKEQGNTIPNF